MNAAWTKKKEPLRLLLLLVEFIECLDLLVVFFALFDSFEFALLVKFDSFRYFITL